MSAASATSLSWYGWVNRTFDDKDLDTFVDTLTSRLTSFDREALGAVKSQINRQGVPRGVEIEASYGVYFSAAASSRALARRVKANVATAPAVISN